MSGKTSEVEEAVGQAVGQFGAFIGGAGVRLAHMIKTGQMGSDLVKECIGKPDLVQRLLEIGFADRPSVEGIFCTELTEKERKVAMTHFAHDYYLGHLELHGGVHPADFGTMTTTKRSLIQNTASVWRKRILDEMGGGKEFQGLLESARQKFERWGYNDYGAYFYYQSHCCFCNTGSKGQEGWPCEICKKRREQLPV